MIIKIIINKWYIHNPESVLENETLKLVGDFEIKTDILISTRQQNPIGSQQQ